MNNFNYLHGWGFLLILLLSSCAKPPPTSPTPQDIAKMTEVNTFTASFNEAYLYYDSIGKAPPRFTGNVPQRFDDLSSFGPYIIGICWWRGNGTRDIQYDRKWWDQLSNIQKQELVYHENGHCQLTRQHRCSTIDINNSIQSIMYPSISDSVSIIGRFEYITAELFDKNSQAINDCPTMQIKRQTNQDLPMMDAYSDLF